MTRSEVTLRLLSIDVASVLAAVVGVVACSKDKAHVAVSAALFLVVESLWVVTSGISVLFWLAAAMLLVGARMAGPFGASTRLMARLVGFAAAAGAGIGLAVFVVRPGANEWTTLADGALWVETMMVLTVLAFAGLWGIRPKAPFGGSRGAAA